MRVTCAGVRRQHALVCSHIVSVGYTAPIDHEAAEGGAGVCVRVAMETPAGNEGALGQRRLSETPSGNKDSQAYL